MPTLPEQCSAAIKEVLQYYRQQRACPCAFPRFRQLLEFHFRHFTDSPVGCHITEIAIALVTEGGGGADPSSGFFHPVPGGNPHDPFHRMFCTTCGSTADVSWEQYNIHLDFSRFTYDTVRPPPLGQDPSARIPLPRGFFGFGDQSIRQAADGFSTEASFDAMIEYLRALRFPWRFR